jgi:hypothetical protein
LRGDHGGAATALVAQPGLAGRRLLDVLDEAVVLGFGFPRGSAVGDSLVRIDGLHDLMLGA